MASDNPAARPLEPLMTPTEKVVYDAMHKALAVYIEENEPLPVDLRAAVFAMNGDVRRNLAQTDWHLVVGNVARMADSMGFAIEIPNEDSIVAEAVRDVFRLARQPDGKAAVDELAARAALVSDHAEEFVRLIARQIAKLGMFTQDRAAQLAAQAFADATVQLDNETTVRIMTRFSKECRPELPSPLMLKIAPLPVVEMAAKKRGEADADPHALDKPGKVSSEAESPPLPEFRNGHLQFGDQPAIRVTLSKAIPALRAAQRCGWTAGSVVLKRSAEDATGANFKNATRDIKKTFAAIPGFPFVVASRSGLLILEERQE